MPETLYTRSMTFRFYLAFVLAFIAGNLTLFIWKSDTVVKFVTFGPAKSQDVIWACYAAEGIRTMYCADLQTVVDNLQQQSAGASHDEELEL